MTLLEAIKVAHEACHWEAENFGAEYTDEQIPFRYELLVEAAAVLARLEEMEPARGAFVLSCETLMGCAMEFEKEWTDRYGDVFRNAAKNYRDWCRVSTKVRLDAAPKEGS